MLLSKGHDYIGEAVYEAAKFYAGGEFLEAGLGAMKLGSLLAKTAPGKFLINELSNLGENLVTRFATKGGMSELQLVAKAAQKAEAAIGKPGNVAGTLKHTYAKDLLSRYQSRFGGDLSLGSNYFNNNATLGFGNRGFLDIVNHKTMTIYDFKFGSAVMNNAQYSKYIRNFPGYNIIIITP